MSHIFITIVQPTVHDVLRAAFYTQHSIPSKCQMISAALSIRLDEISLRDDWKILEKEVTRNSVVRNQLAHGVMWLVDGVPTLGPHLSNVKALEKFSAINSASITAESIRQVQIAFGELHAKLADFDRQVGLKVMSFGKPINLPAQHN